MTSMEIANAHLPIGSPTRSIAELAEAIDQALREERERCAKIGDAEAERCSKIKRFFDPAPDCWQGAYEDMAEKIRSLE